MNPPFTQRATSLRIDLERILTLKDKALEEALAPLRFEETLELVLSAPWDKRASIILASSYAEGLVRNLPPVELFFTLKGSSLDLAVELLSYAKGSQIQFLFDFDAWFKDRIRPERVASWIVLLFEAGESRVLDWLAIADWDFLLALLQKFIKIHKRPDDVDLIEAYDYLPPYTLDDVYFIEFKDERVEFYFRRIIEIIREEWPETYFALMESLIWELPTETEERAFRFRNGRLADEGIPDYYTSLEVYTYVHPKGLAKIDPRVLALTGEEVPQHTLHLIPYEGPQELFVVRALALIQDASQRERIHRELAWLATKVILVDNPVIDGLEEVKKGLNKMWCHLNLGLEYLAEGNLTLAKEFLENYYLEEIFRVSGTALRELRRFALNLFQSKHFNSSLLKYLDQPYAGYLQGASARKLNEVKLFNPVGLGTSEEFIEFSMVSELRMVRRYLEEVAYMAPLLEKGLGPLSNWIKETLQPKRNFDLNFLTWSSVILTSLANYLCSGEFIFKAFPQSKWPLFFTKIAEVKDGKTHIQKGIQEELYHNFARLAKTTYYLEEELLKSYLDFVVELWEREFRFADPADPPDSKYQTLILIDLSL